MNILHVYPKSDYFTGAAIQLLDLARGLARRGHHVVVATRPAESWAERCRHADLPYYAIPMRSEIDLRSVPPLIRIIRRHHVEVVHCHKGKARTLALMAGLFVRIPVLILGRGVSFRLDRFNRLGYTTARVTAIVAVSQSIKRGLVAQGVPAGKITVIYSGTDTDRLLVPPRDPRALATALLRLIHRPDHARAMARAGRERVVATFSQDAKIRRTEALYRQLLDERRGTPAALPSVMVGEPDQRRC